MNIKLLSISTLLLFSFNFASGKVVDCQPIKLNEIEYSSHDNYINAYDTINNKELWRTQLFIENFSDDFNIFLEEDAQYNIACILSVNETQIVAEDKRHRTFYLDPKNGDLLYKTKNGKVVTGNELTTFENIIQNLKAMFGIFFYIAIFLIIALIYMLVNYVKRFKR